MWPARRERGLSRQPSLVGALPSTYVFLNRGAYGLPIEETGRFEALIRDWIHRIEEWARIARAHKGLARGVVKKKLGETHVQHKGGSEKYGQAFPTKPTRLLNLLYYMV
ncbi:hypothetical protein PDIG_76430 [Penicillium digitatum PHI26]|uniref:Uncharacterized protein n=2 Tax=Penicillium digitatum TaxID=36651 RepID=K9FBH5_PEND2|nr:hypothetical protein PDIP_29860 [Penicillium digitatum Pd1]EKV06760.1 hypothetical protein PDIG_76430 [Penicillium digitatum PHI26]EKV17789.1 hypothetical protein PDIP_29860 [Penicillium digitatum Pd1]